MNRCKTTLASDRSKQACIDGQAWIYRTLSIKVGGPKTEHKPKKEINILIQTHNNRHQDKKIVKNLNM